VRYFSEHYINVQRPVEIYESSNHWGARSKRPEMSTSFALVLGPAMKLRLAFCTP